MHDFYSSESPLVLENWSFLTKLFIQQRHIVLYSIHVGADAQNVRSWTPDLYRVDPLLCLRNIKSAWMHLGLA